MELTTHSNGQLKIAAPDFRMEPVAGIAFELDKTWDFVRLGIEEIIAKSHFEGMSCSRVQPRCTVRDHLVYKYRPEDAYLALRTNRATLYLTWLRGRLTGFCICLQAADPSVIEPPRLVVWCAYFRDHETRRFCALELEVLAQQLNLREIRLCSTRKGWLRHKPTEEWEILTSRGWLKDMTNRDVQGLMLAPEITLRRLL